MTVEAVLNSPRGLVVAPAGCGKTHLITETLLRKQSKPYLVLTHTTAGVAALKQRLKRLGAPNSHFVLSTIDGWALRVAKMFPNSCDIQADANNPQVFYPELRAKVNQYVGARHIAEIIGASYSRLLVDEYQDCNTQQHALVCALSEMLPTVIFGDPLQCIFNFGGPMPSWNNDIISRFPVIAELDIPWRWINSGNAELGQWILNCRGLLLNRQPIDLTSCPAHVNWGQLSANPQDNIRTQSQAQYRIRAQNPETDSLLVIGDPQNFRARHNFASISLGVDVVEPVDMRDITSIAGYLDVLVGTALVEKILESASTMMTGVGRAQIIKRLPIILAGKNRTPPSDIEEAAKVLFECNSRHSLLRLIDVLEVSPTTRIFRKGAYSALKNAVMISCNDSSKNILQAAEIVREKRRHQGDRRIPLRAIGSTLLLKGLEADHTLILDASAMTASNLYVALSRGAKSVTVFSTSQTVP
jgi:hypothetical protein